MSTRDFAVRAISDWPDERHKPEAERLGPAVALAVTSKHLRAQPVDAVRLTDDEALVLATGILSRLAAKKGLRP